MFTSTLLAAAAALLSLTTEARSLPSTANGNGYIKYTTVKGYFLQDEPSTNSTTFNYVCYTDQLPRVSIVLTVC